MILVAASLTVSSGANRVQLVRSTQILQDELKENPDDQGARRRSSRPGRCLLTGADHQLREADLSSAPVRLCRALSDFIEAVAENRATILRRSDRIQAVRRQLQALAPHRAELVAAGQQPSTISAAVNEATHASPPAADEQDGGLYL